MTKSEVRAVIISKLQLERDSVCYDVGAGTGSVSVEMAYQCDKGMVYAIETKEEALDLIAENKKEFGLSNIEIIKGMAPAALEDLPCPTKVFVGGSKGNMKEIIFQILSKWEITDLPDIRFVISAIALETISEAITICREAGLEDVDITQVAVSKSKCVGNYHMMTGQNPIYIISGRKGRVHES